MNLFKTPISLNILFDLLDKICLYKDNHYIIDMNSYNKMIYLDLYNPFVQIIKDNYQPCKLSKLIKICNEPSYYHFIVLIKQICNHHKINIKSKLLCSNSLKYTIYFLESCE